VDTLQKHIKENQIGEYIDEQRLTIEELNLQISNLKKEEAKHILNCEIVKQKASKLEEDNRMLRKQLESQTDQLKQLDAKFKDYKNDSSGQKSTIKKHEDQMK